MLTMPQALLAFSNGYMTYIELWSHYEFWLPWATKSYLRELFTGYPHKWSRKELIAQIECNLKFDRLYQQLNHERNNQ